jgi:hypothetical protein
MQKKVMLCVAALLVVAGLAVSVQVRAADDPNSGTWKLNVAKSKFGAGPAIKMETTTISIENGTEKYKAEGTDANGKTLDSSLEAKLDGTDAPITGNPNGDTISIKRTDSHHSVAHLKKDGKDTVTVRVVVSKDGMTRTQTITGKTPDGKAVNQTLVFEKQM